MLGLSGFVNRLGYHETEWWYSEEADEAMWSHMDETGCPGTGWIDAFNDSDYLYWHWCGDAL